MRFVGWHAPSRHYVVALSQPYVFDPAGALDEDTEAEEAPTPPPGRPLPSRKERRARREAHGGPPFVWVIIVAG